MDNGGAAYGYDPLNYLVLSVTLPLGCQIVKATSAEPFIACIGPAC